MKLPSTTHNNTLFILWARVYVIPPLESAAGLINRLFAKPPRSVVLLSSGQGVYLKCIPFYHSHSCFVQFLLAPFALYIGLLPLVSRKKLSNQIYAEVWPGAAFQS